jgi:hypothetical protein
MPTAVGLVSRQGELSRTDPHRSALIRTDPHWAEAGLAQLSSTDMVSGPNRRNG